MAGEVSAGDLRLDILGFSESAISSIDRTTKSLNALSRSMNNFDKALPLTSANTLSMFFKKISEATNSLNTASLDRLASSAKALSSLSRIGNLGKLDFGAVGTGFELLSEKIEPFLNKVKEAEASLTSLNGIMSKSGKLSNFMQEDKGGKGKNGGLLSLVKWTAVVHFARKLGGWTYKIAQHGADFAETLNLWKVAMGTELLPQATAFVDKLSEAYGISKETLMNAQATFKNMLGSLGKISDQQAYIMSEGITQMALDYASLYNQSFEDAFTKFQAALAGQVRPIRSVSGFDITETTLADLYASLGGEKTIRQLNRTEKQLLSILAIYNQMGKSGAQGDLARTINSFANQSRVAKDQMKEILSYSGAILTNWLSTSGIMSKVVGFLIFVSDVLEEVAKSKGALEQGTSDVFGDVSDSASDAEDAVDDLQAKLLGFDKFRALNQDEETDIGLDQTLIDALSKYQSALGNVDMEANAVAERLKEISGLFDENGVFNLQQWEKLIDNVKDFAIAIGVAFSVANCKKILDFATSIFSVKNGFGALSGVLAGGALYFLLKAIDAFREGDIVAGVLCTTISVALVGAFVLLNKQAIATALTALGKFISTLLLTNVIAGGSTLMAIVRLATSFGALGAAIAGALLIAQNWGNMNWWQKLIGIVGVATTAILGLAIAMGAFQSAWSFGAAAAGIVAGIAMIAASVASAKKDAEVPVSYYAEGGLPDKGSLFIAGEAGAEYVYDMGGGQSGVANVQQIAQATYQGTMSALRDWWGGTGAKGDIPQLQEANSTGMYQAVTKVAKSYGEKWSKY